MPNKTKMKPRNMLKFFRYFCLLSLLLLAVISTQAQFTAETRNGQSAPEEMPTSIKETLAKQKIKKDKEDYAELIERGEEALKLSEQLANSFDTNKKLSKSDYEKLNRLEKLLKKIRKELGGGDDDEQDETEDRPSNLGDAVKNLRDNTVSLFDALQKTTRYSISAVAIQSSNTVLNIVKFMRFWKN